jgi:predicted ArsR family transcriptional regulator
MLPDTPPGMAKDVSSSARERMRTRSKLLFGNGDRLEVALAVATSTDGVVNATDLSWELRIANNRVRAQLLALTQLGLLEPGPPDDRKRWYVRRPSSFWQTCVDLHEAWST